MNKYRVTLEAIDPKAGRSVKSITVEAESDFMASRIAEGKAKSMHPGWGNRIFNIKKIEKIK